MTPEAKKQRAEREDHNPRVSPGNEGSQRGNPSDTVFTRSRSRRGSSGASSDEELAKLEAELQESEIEEMKREATAKAERAEANAVMARAKRIELSQKVEARRSSSSRSSRTSQASGGTRLSEALGQVIDSNAQLVGYRGSGTSTAQSSATPVQGNGVATSSHVPLSTVPESQECGEGQEPDGTGKAVETKVAPIEPTAKAGAQKAAEVTVEATNTARTEVSMLVSITEERIRMAAEEREKRIAADRP